MLRRSSLLNHWNGNLLLVRRNAVHHTSSKRSHERVRSCGLRTTCPRIRTDINILLMCGPKCRRSSYPGTMECRRMKRAAINVALAELRAGVPGSSSCGREASGPSRAEIERAAPVFDEGIQPRSSLTCCSPTVRTGTVFPRCSSGRSKDGFAQENAFAVMPKRSMRRRNVRLALIEPIVDGK